MPSCLWTSFLAELLRGPSLGGKGGKRLSPYLAASLESTRQPHMHAPRTPKEGADAFFLSSCSWE